MNYAELISHSLGPNAGVTSCREVLMVNAFSSSRSTWRAVDLVFKQGGVRKIGELFDPEVQKSLRKLPIREAGWMALARELARYPLSGKDAKARQKEVMARCICRIITDGRYPKTK